MTFPRPPLFVFTLPTRTFPREGEQLCISLLHLLVLLPAMTKIEPESISRQPSSTTTMTMVELERSLVFAMAMPEPDAIRPLQSSTTTGELNTILLRTIVDHWEGGHSVMDYSEFMREYRQHADNAQGVLPEDSNVDGAGSS